MSKSAKKHSTLQVMKKAEGREVIIAGELATVHFPEGKTLSLLASKLFVQLTERAGAEIIKDKEHRIALADLNWSHRDLDFIEGAVRELQRTVIEVTVSTNKGERRLSGQFLTDVARDLDAATGELCFHFSNTVRGVIRNSSHWAAIQSKAVMAFESKYSVWLYQLVALHANRREAGRVWDLHELRSQLGATAKTNNRWPDFRRYVLEPAVSEINHLTDVMVEWEPVKKGRKVVGVKLYCHPKDKTQLAEAKAELDQSRTGRKARREDNVEHLADERSERAALFDKSLRQADLLDDDVPY